MSKASREREARKEEARDKREMAELEKLIEDGPHWTFCPHINRDCHRDCYYISKPYFGDYSRKTRWSCTYRSPDDFVLSW